MKIRAIFNPDMLSETRMLRFTESVFVYYKVIGGRRFVSCEWFFRKERAACSCHSGSHKSETLDNDICG